MMTLVYLRYVRVVVVILEHCDVWEDEEADDDYLAQVEQLLKLGPELEVEKV